MLKLHAICMNISIPYPRIVRQKRCAGKRSANEASMTNRTKARAVLTAAFALILAAHVHAGAGEAILRFDSDVELRRDGSQRVTETVRVYAEGNRIKRGIFRDFPLRTANGGKATFTVRSVAVDGVDSSHHKVERTAEKVRVIMGNPSSLLSRGEHVFVLAYETSGHLRLFDEHDEFGWNVTGDAWEFAINEASCRVALPEGAVIEKSAGWQGKRGARDAPVTHSSAGDNAAVFQTEKPIRPGEHFTVAVSFPKGVVAISTATFWQRQGRTIVVLAVTFVFFFLAWLIWGRDPKPGTIIPLFHPPETGCDAQCAKGGRATGKVLSAAAASYLKNGAVLNARAFSSIFIALAARGLCQLRSGRDGVFSVTPRKAPAGALANCAKEEAAAYRILIDATGGADHPFALSGENTKTVIEIHNTVIDILGKRFAPLWAQNIWLQIIGWVVAFPAAALAMNSDTGIVEALFQPAVLVCIVVLLRKQIAYSWSRSINRFNPIKALSFVFIALTILFHVRSLSLIGTFLGLAVDSLGNLTFGAVALAAIPLAFCPAMKRPSKACRRLLDKIDGLLMYIAAAESDRLKEMNPPDTTPETFDRLLPYAAAFGLEDTWCARFAAQLAVKDAEETSDDASYSSDLYDFSRDRGMSMFTSAVTAAAVPPPSTSGGDDGSWSGNDSFFSDDGGGAGSGGGGGGGGGW